MKVPICLFLLATFCFSSQFQVLQDGPSIETWIDSIKIDSIKYSKKIDSVLLLTTTDQTLDPLLDKCYREYHIKKHREISNNWFIEERNSCNEIAALQFKVAKINQPERNCKNCFFMSVTPFDRPNWFVTLGENNKLEFTEVYGRNNMLGLTRKKIEVTLDYLDLKEIEFILKDLRSVSSTKGPEGLDGTGVRLKGTIDGEQFIIDRWCFHDFEKMNKWLQKKLGIKIGDC